MVYQNSFFVSTLGRGTYEVTHDIAKKIESCGINTGICTVFIHHTSASLIITENADPTVQQDIETIMRRLAPDGDPEYRHDYEGDDDMSGHVRCLLTNDSLTIPVSNGLLNLGTWQGLFVYEHRYRGHQRKLTVTVLGS